jgi:WD40 repeat protein
LLSGQLPGGRLQAADRRDLGPGTIAPEAPSILPGRPLGRFALVSQPAPLPGVLSWTIETRRFRGELASLAVSPDGRQVAIGGMDSAIRIWELETGKLLRTMLGHDRNVGGLAWSPDGGVIASTGWSDCTVRLWDARTSRPLRVFKKFADQTEHVAWSPDGMRLAAAGGDSGWIWLWNANREEGRPLTEMGERVASIDWSPDGQKLAVAVENKAVAIIDAQSGKAIENVGDGLRSPRFARWSPDGRLLAVGTESDAAVYELPGGKPRWKIDKRGFSCAWSPDSSQVVLVLSDDVQLLSAISGSKLRSFNVFVFDLRWVGADRLVIINGTELSCWAPSSGQRLAAYELGWRSPPIWNGVLPLVNGIGTESLTLWDHESGRKLRTLQGHTAAIRSVAWTRKGDLLASAAEDHTVRIWEPESGKLLRTLDHHSARITAVAWSPDEKTLATGASDCLVRLWDSAGNVYAKLSGHDKPIGALAWAPRGNLLASGGGDNVVKLWDVATGKLDRDIPTTREVFALAFSPNGVLLAGGTADAAIQLWRVAGGRKLKADAKNNEQAPQVTALCWSADGKILAAGRENAIGQLWDWQARRSLQFLSVARFRYLTWTPSGSCVVAGDSARSTYFWDRATRVRRGVIVNQDDHLLLIAPNGYYRTDPGVQPDIVFAVQTASEQLMLSPAEFASRYHWQNNPLLVKLGK